jgi:hypothetical protein
MNIVRAVKLHEPDSELEYDCVNVGLTCTKYHHLSYLLEHGFHDVNFYFEFQAP